MRLLLLAFAASLLHAEVHQAPRFDLTYATAQGYCRGLGADGRTMSIRELFALRQDPRFKADASYWSATSTYDGISRGDTGSEGEGRSMKGAKIGYTLYMRDGDVTLSPIAKKAGVICTDTPPPPYVPRYETSDAGTVDHENGLLWLPLDHFDKNLKFTYAQAREYCDMLDHRERIWRLPDVEELYGIVTYERTQPSVDVDAFGYMMSRYYWSADTFGDDAAYVVGFKLGSVATSSRANRSYFRCVSDLNE
jgi:hypothetical protein